MPCLDIDQLKTAKFWKALFVEFLGTLLLILVGCGSCPGNDIVRISLTFGLGIATLVWTIGHVSGGHLNPATTAGFLVTRKFDIIRYSILFSIMIFSSTAVKNKQTKPYNLTTRRPTRNDRDKGNSTHQKNG